MDDSRRLELLQKIVAGNLKMGGVSDELANQLASPEVVLESLLNETPSWEAVYAAASHIQVAQRFLDSVTSRFKTEVVEQLEYLVARSGLNPPRMEAGWNRSPVILDHNPDMSIYFHSRCALALLLRDQPDRVIELLSPLERLFPPYTNDMLSRDIQFGGHDWRILLQDAYASTHDFQNALRLHLRTLGFGSTVETYEVADLYTKGWLAQILEESATLEEWQGLCDICLSILEGCPDTDEEDRDDLAECGLNTPQYWAWRYGWVVGEVASAKPYLGETLLEQVQSTDWVSGWHAVALLSILNQSIDWTRFRTLALGMYHSADPEYGGSGTPYGQRQPAHLTPQGDLYWAMRVGFADAVLARMGGRTQSYGLLDIMVGLERIQSTVTSHSQRSIRAEIEQSQALGEIHDRLPRSIDQIRDDIESHIGPMIGSAPASVINSLIDAERFRDSGTHSSEAITAMARAVEALVHELVMTPVQASSKDIVLSVSRNRRGETGTYNPIDWSYLQLWQWGEVFKELGTPDHSKNEAFASELSSLYPSLDLNRLSGVGDRLREVSELRGGSAHHQPGDGYEAERRQLEALRASVLGVDCQSLIVEFIEALGQLEGPVSEKTG